MRTSEEDMEEGSLEVLTQMFGSRDIAVERYDEMVTRAKAEDIVYTATQYQRDRKEAYNSINQFELMTDDAINGTTSHLDAIESIKAKYPKPEEV